MADFVIEDVIFKDGLFCFLVKDVPFLVFVDIKNEMELKIVKIEEESPCFDNVGRKIKYWKDNIVITPGFDNSIKLYNLSNGQWRSIILPKKERNRLNRIFCAEIYENKLFLYGCILPEIIKCDLVTGNIETEGAVFDKIRNHLDTNDVIFHRYSYVRRDDSVIIPIAKFPLLLEYNMKKESYSWHCIDGINNGFSVITSNDDYIWTITKDLKTLTRVDKYYRTDNFVISSNRKSKCVFNLEQKGKKLYIYSLSDQSTDKHESYLLSNEEVKLIDTYGKYQFVKREENYFLEQTFEGDIVFSAYDMNDYLIRKKIFIELLKDCYILDKKLITEYFDKLDTAKETEIIGVKELLYAIE